MREHVSTTCPSFKSNGLALSYQLLSSNCVFLSDTPTDQPVLSTLTHRVCQVPKLRGQIGSIMVIGASQLIFSLTWRRNLKRKKKWQRQVVNLYWCKYLKSCLHGLFFFFFPNPTFGRSWRLLISLHKGVGSWWPLS
jgi:hypothetical protein